MTPSSSLPVLPSIHTYTHDLFPLRVWNQPNSSCSFPRTCCLARRGIPSSPWVLSQSTSGHATCLGEQEFSKVILLQSQLQLLTELVLQCQTGSCFQRAVLCPLPVPRYIASSGGGIIGEPCLHTLTGVCLKKYKVWKNAVCLSLRRCTIVLQPLVSIVWAPCM